MSGFTPLSRICTVFFLLNWKELILEHSMEEPLCLEPDEYWPLPMEQEELKVIGLMGVTLIWLFSSELAPQHPLMDACAWKDRCLFSLPEEDEWPLSAE